MNARTLRRRYGHFPTIARLKNRTKITVYAEDASHGPHIQVVYKGAEGEPTRLSIQDGSLIGRLTIKKKDLRVAREWLRDNRDYAMACWRELNPLVR